MELVREGWVLPEYKEDIRADAHAVEFPAKKNDHGGNRMNTMFRLAAPSLGAAAQLAKPLLLAGLVAAGAAWAADTPTGVLPWEKFANVTLVKEKDRYVPRFGAELAALEKKELRVQGFMMPLDTGARQKRFLLSALPPECGFCMPGGPEQVVEVQAKTPVKYVLEPIVISGRLVLVRDDPGGLLYRLTDAVSVDK